MNRKPSAVRASTRTAAACGLALACPLALATLGEPAWTVEADQARLHATRSVTAATPSRPQVHVIVQADGSTVKEFVTPAGIVFAVAWHTRLKPRLDALLGAQAARYAAAASAAMATPGIRHGLTLASDDLVVQASAHLNAHSGVAYLRSLVPEGVRIDELR
jgi:hypothetical protein